MTDFLSENPYIGIPALFEPKTPIKRNPTPLTSRVLDIRLIVAEIHGFTLLTVQGRELESITSFPLGKLKHHHRRSLALLTSKRSCLR